MNASVENACRLLLSMASTVRRLLTACWTYCFFSSGRGARLVAKDLREVVTRLDRVEGVDVDGLREQRLGLAGVAVLPGDVAEVRDRGAVLHALPDLDGVVLVAALLQHGALVEARLEQRGVLVGGALEGAGD